MPADQSRNELFLSQEFAINDLDAARTVLTTKETVLALSGDVAKDRLPQVAVLTAGSILCRLGPYCPKIAVLAPADTTVAPGVPLLPTGAPFGRALCEFMSSIQRPGTQAERHYRLAAPGDSFALAFIAGEAGVSAGHVLYADYERWTGGFAATSHELNYRGSNPFGAMLAGALAAAAISRLLLSPFATPGTTFTPLPDRVVLSAYSYALLNDPSTEPELPVTGVTLQPLEPLLIVGGGAVASGAVYALACLERAVGTLGCADDDPLDSTNLERHLVSTWTDVGILKVDRLARIFGDGGWNGLRLQPHSCRYENLSNRAWRTVVATVDNPETRRRLQFDLPQILLNGGTVGPEYLVSRHDYGSGPCAECLYPVHSGAAQSPAEVLAAQTGLDAAEITRLQATGARLTSGQIVRIAQGGALIFTPEALESARREGIAALSPTLLRCTGYYDTRMRAISLVSGSNIIALVFGITQNDGGPTCLDDPGGIVTSCGSYPTTSTRIPARWRDRDTARTTASLNTPSIPIPAGTPRHGDTLVIGNLLPLNLGPRLDLARGLALTLGRQLRAPDIGNCSQASDHLAHADPHIYDSLPPQNLDHRSLAFAISDMCLIALNSIAQVLLFRRNCDPVKRCYGIHVRSHLVPCLWTIVKQLLDAGVVMHTDQLLARLIRVHPRLTVRHGIAYQSVEGHATPERDSGSFRGRRGLVLQSLVSRRRPQLRVMRLGSTVPAITGRPGEECPLGQRRTPLPPTASFACFLYQCLDGPVFPEVQIAVKPGVCFGRR